MLERKIAASRLLQLGFGRGDVKAQLAEKYGLTPAQCENALAAVEADLQAEYDAARPVARAMAIHRLRGVIIACRSPQTIVERVRAASSSGRKIGEEQVRTRELPPDYRAVLAAEQLLARIEGTMVPQRVTVEHRALPAALSEYMATLTEDDCERLYEEGRQLPALPASTQH